MYEQKNHKWLGLVKENLLIITMLTLVLFLVSVLLQNGIGLAFPKVWCYSWYWQHYTLGPFTKMHQLPRRQTEIWLHRLHQHHIPPPSRPHSLRQRLGLGSLYYGLCFLPEPENIHQFASGRQTKRHLEFSSRRDNGPLQSQISQKRHGYSLRSKQNSLTFICILTRQQRTKTKIPFHLQHQWWRLPISHLYKRK